jgi:hypothetical protein
LTVVPLNAAVVSPLPAAAGPALLALLLSTSLGLSTRALAQASAEPAGSSQVATPDSVAGAKGARIYCYMRNAGNTHKVSWEAAYALIKRQNASLFKTSPEHAAVMITEAVVNNPSAYPDCGKFLGDLFVK